MISFKLSESFARRRLAILFTALLCFVLPARAACTAGSTSANVPETTPTSAFTDNGDGTVTHALTGLTWKRCAQGQSWNGSTGHCDSGASIMTWSDALASAVGEATGGRSDWRLPNRNELESIVEICGEIPAINQTIFPDMPSASGYHMEFWSSTSYAADPTAAWFVYFHMGYAMSAGKASTIYVRLVRGGQAFDALDTTPNAFSFADQTGVARSAQVTSAAVQISGINTTTNWTASGGQACASSGNNCNCDVSAWGTSGSIDNSQYLCATHTSSASFGTATDTVVMVGGVADTFTSTTLAADTAPNAFAFVDQTGVARSVQVTSAAVQMTGINTTTNWTASGGQACASSGNNCNCDVAAWGTSGSIDNNQYLCARHTSSASFGTVTNTVVTVGGVADTFTSTTLAADTAPNAFAFVDQTGVTRSVQVTSVPVQISGISTTTNWTASGGQACASSGNNCNCDVSAWGTSGSIDNNQYLCARHTSSGNFATATNTVVTVGGVADTFSSTTPAPVTTYSGPTGAGTASATLSGGGNCGFTSAQFIPLSSVPTPPPADLAFPQGLFDFTLGGGCTPGSTVTLSITYPQTLPVGSRYWKYGPTSSDANPHWYAIPATIAGNTAIFSITDGGLGDDDLAANGTIVDQGGPAAAPFAVPSAVPTLSEWSLLLLILLLTLVPSTGICRGRPDNREDYPK